MKELELFKSWLAQPLDPELKTELEYIKSNTNEIYDRFYTDLSFGTAGLRGVLGAGLNRMNIYTVGRATQGLANYLKESFAPPSVAIAYDSRINSDVFARRAAGVLAANGIKVYLYSELMPTPALSYAVRQLKCSAGIVITASHNPAKYNGYKVYDPDGCQIGPEIADRVQAHIRQTDIFTGVRYQEFDQALASGLVEYIPESLVESFVNRILEEQQNPGICEGSTFKLVYTPLNGAGRRCVLEVLDKISLKNITVVPQQEYPDGNFPTCPYPNPELKEALQLGLALCKEKGADLLLATDPDCDRVATAVMQAGSPRLLTGNEIGVLLLDYIARSRSERGTMPANPVAVRSIVSSNMFDAVAAHYGIEVLTTLTGFKYIGEHIKRFEQAGQADRYLLGFEESCGYLSGGYVRDKDGVGAALLICEMAVWYHKQGKNLAQAIDELYSKFGYFSNTVDNLSFEGANGMRRMGVIMNRLRSNVPIDIGGYAIDYTIDYDKSEKTTRYGRTSQVTLPRSNVIEFALEGVGTVIVRPSGTEPKLKVYYSIKAATREEAEEITDDLREAMKRLMGV